MHTFTELITYQIQPVISYFTKLGITTWPKIYFGPPRAEHWYGNSVDFSQWTCLTKLTLALDSLAFVIVANNNRNEAIQGFAWSNMPKSTSPLSYHTKVQPIVAQSRLALILTKDDVIYVQPLDLLLHKSSLHAIHILITAD